MVHWINYLQVEEVTVETPIPVGAIEAECGVPDGFTVDRVEWHYPEMKEPVTLGHEMTDSRVAFAIPNLIVYGMSIIHLRRRLENRADAVASSRRADREEAALQ